MTGILFDLDGVIYQKGKAIPGAVETLAWARQHNIPHLFVTNTSSKPRAAIVEKLASFGIPTSAEHILTPPVAACTWLNSELPNARIALYVAEQTKQDFLDFHIVETHEPEVNAVIIGDLGEKWTFSLLNNAFRQLISPASPYLIALGMTRYWKTPEGLQLDVGPFVKALEYASGCEANVCGKPSPTFFEAAANQLELPVEHLIMIGDDIQGDIGGAQKAGLQGMLVKTGKFRNADLKQGITPNATLNSIADLPDWWE